MIAAQQLELDHDGQTAPHGAFALVIVTVSAPPVEVRVLDPWRIATGGGRPTAQDRHGRPLRADHDGLELSYALASGATVDELRLVVDHLARRMREATPAPVSSWLWLAVPIPAADS